MEQLDGAWKKIGERTNGIQEFEILEGQGVACRQTVGGHQTDMPCKVKAQQRTELKEKTQIRKYVRIEDKKMNRKIQEKIKHPKPKR